MCQRPHVDCCLPHARYTQSYPTNTTIMQTLQCVRHLAWVLQHPIKLKTPNSLLYQCIWSGTKILQAPRNLKCKSPPFRDILSIILSLSYGLNYIDNIIMSVCDLHDQSQNLFHVCSLLQAHGFCVNLNKLKLAQPTVCFLGFQVSAS